MSQVIHTVRGVKGGEEGFPVEIWRDAQTGKLELVVYGEAGYIALGIDFADLIGWLCTPAAQPFLTECRALGAHNFGNL